MDSEDIVHLVEETVKEVCERLIPELVEAALRRTVVPTENRNLAPERTLTLYDASKQSGLAGKTLIDAILAKRINATRTEEGLWVIHKDQKYDAFVDAQIRHESRHPGAN